MFNFGLWTLKNPFDLDHVQVFLDYMPSQSQTPTATSCRDSLLVTRAATYSSAVRTARLLSTAPPLKLRCVHFFFFFFEKETKAAADLKC